jgi:aconitate hydratase
MTGTLLEKIVAEHCVEEVPTPGEEIGIRVDQTLTQDATGTMVYLELEALGIQNVKARLSVSYVDHNTLQTGFENADDHLYLQTVASRHGVLFSKPGNGICHQVHLERFTVPGGTLVGSDSHTPTAGGAAMLAIGAGGLDVAVAMGGGPFYLTMPKVVGMRLNGKLKPWTCAKDVALEVLRRFGVRGGVGRALEYGGDGLRNLSVPERASIANMGTETGATTSIFPSDQATLDFLKLQRREHDWKPLCPDGDAIYDEIVEIELEQLEPLVARPHSPDNIARVSDLEGMRIDQVAIGSCTNSSLEDLMTVATVLKGRRVHPDVSLVISPGSRQVLLEMTRNGALISLLEAGARVLEPACGPCIGMGQAPPSGGVSIRTFNRNFVGRSGTQDAEVYLVSPKTAAVSAIAGVLTDPRKVKPISKIRLPSSIVIDDSMIIKPASNPESVEVVRGPNIRPIPIRNGLPQDLAGEVLIKVGDNVTTDHIMPAGPKIMALRSNVEAIAEHVFESVDPTFVKRAKERKGGLIVGGENYGQGSSREHAAMAPMYLGVTAVIAKSFARIHQANLVNFGIIPLSFKDPQDYEETHQGDGIQIDDIRGTLQAGRTTLSCRNTTSGREFIVTCSLPRRLGTVLVDGGLLNHTRLVGVRSR